MPIAQRKIFHIDESRSGKLWKWAGLLWLLFWPQNAALAENSLRIISVDANATELLSLGGLSEQLIAVDMTSHSLLNNQQVADLGYHRSLSAEAILSLEPDILVGSEHMGPESTVNMLKRAGIEILVMPVPLTTEQLMTNINTVSSRFGSDQPFEPVRNALADYQQTLNSAKHLNASKAMTFLLQLNERGLSQAGSGTAGDALINLVGGKNISRFANYKPVSTEALIDEDPQVILLGSELPEQQAKAELLRQYPIFAHGDAFRNAQVYVISPSMLVAGLSLSAVKAAAEISAQLQSQELH